jgi:hypothetical protein
MVRMLCPLLEEAPQLFASHWASALQPSSMELGQGAYKAPMPTTFVGRL